MEKSLIIIPARGGSKEVPRKNLRLLNNKPLIYYVIKSAKMVNFEADIFISSEDEEVLQVAKYYGNNILKRDKRYSQDKTTLDEVIYDSCFKIEKKTGLQYSTIITLQPTSPFISTNDLNLAYKKFKSNKYDSLISVQLEKHLYWKKNNNNYKPLFKKRVNRQFLEPLLKENGAMLFCSRTQMLTGTRIGKKLAFYELTNYKSMDIDTNLDFKVCEKIFNTKRIIFIVSNFKNRNFFNLNYMMIIAYAISGHSIEFICKKNDDQAISFIKKRNFKVVLESDFNFFNIDKNKTVIFLINKDMRLEFLKLQKLKKNIKTFNIDSSNLFKNIFLEKDLFNMKKLTNNMFFGIRNEFLYLKASQLNRSVSKVVYYDTNLDRSLPRTKLLLKIMSLMEKSSVKLIIILAKKPKEIDKILSIIKNNKSNNFELVIKKENIAKYFESCNLIVTYGNSSMIECASLNIATLVIGLNTNAKFRVLAKKIGLKFFSISKDNENIFLKNLEKNIFNYSLRKANQKKIKSENLKKELSFKLASLIDYIDRI